MCFLKMALLAVALTAAMAFLSVAQTTETAIQGIWAVNDGEKVERDDRNNPNKAGNSAWDGQKVRLFGARNEILAFQLVVEAGSRGIDALSI